MLRTGPAVCVVPHRVALNIREQTIAGIVGDGDRSSRHAAQPGVEQLSHHAVGAIVSNTGLTVGRRQFPSVVAQLVDAVEVTNEGHCTPPIHYTYTPRDEISSAQVVIARTGIIIPIGRIVHRRHRRDDLVHQIRVARLHTDEQVRVRTSGHVRHVVVNQCWSVRNQASLRRVHPQHPHRQQSRYLPAVFHDFPPKSSRYSYVLQEAFLYPDTQDFTNTYFSPRKSQPGQTEPEKGKCCWLRSGTNKGIVILVENSADARDIQGF